MIKKVVIKELSGNMLIFGGLEFANFVKKLEEQSCIVVYDTKNKIDYGRTDNARKYDHQNAADYTDKCHYGYKCRDLDNCLY
jgi:hypothetical protein